MPAKSQVAEPWELVYSTTHEYMERTPVEGGFLYRNWVQTGTDSLAQHVLMAFVPTAPPIAPINVTVPYVSEADGMLNCTMGTWENDPTSYSYQWMRNGTIAVGTDSNNYTLGPDDTGGTMTCIVTATNAAGSAIAPPSNAIQVP